MPAFIDLNLIIDKSLQEEGFIGILGTGKTLGVILIPVISLNTDKALQKTIISSAKKNGFGICLKLFRSDFSIPGSLASNIQRFMQEHTLLEKDVDLLIDFKITDDQCLNLIPLSQEIPNIFKWRTFTFVSGAFPVDLTGCEIGRNDLPRLDWKYWISQMNLFQLERKPSFGDYTIQHPIYKPQTRFFAPSASIRYSLKENWLIMRGQKGQNKQYLANAQLLSKLPEFFGGNFSEGDAFIMEKGKDLTIDKPGNAMSWLRAGINHHLACTADQIASLS